jgi:hypothetical protein
MSCSLAVQAGTNGEAATGNVGRGMDATGRSGASLVTLIGISSRAFALLVMRAWRRQNDSFNYMCSALIFSCRTLPAEKSPWLWQRRSTPSLFDWKSAVGKERVQIAITSRNK